MLRPSSASGSCAIVTNQSEDKKVTFLCFSGFHLNQRNIIFIHPRTSTQTLLKKRFTLTGPSWSPSPSHVLRALPEVVFGHREALEAAGFPRQALEGR